MKKRIVLLAIVALALILFAAFQSLRSRDSQLPKGILSSNGRIEAEQIDIAAKSAGRLTEVLVQEGDIVSVGQVVARIDTTELQAERAKYLADMAAAQASAQQAQAIIGQRRAELVFKQANMQRALAVASTGSISQQTQDEAVSERNTARAALVAAQQSAVSSRGAIEAARAQVRQIDAQIADASLVAPTHGRVLYRLARTGEVVGAGGKVLTIVDLSDVYMEIYLDAEQASRVPLGSSARILIDGAYNALPARVSFISPDAQFTPKQIETRSEREKLVFRAKLRVPQSYVARHIGQIKTGVRGMGYVRLDPKPPVWPQFLQRRAPGDPVDAEN